MKINWKVPGMTALTLLYCMVISLVHSHLVNLDFRRLTDPGQERFLTAVYGNLLCHTLPNEISGPEVQLLYIPLDKKFPAKEVDPGIGLEQQLVAVSCGYFAFAEKLLIRFRATTIIFPFQYFW